MKMTSERGQSYYQDKRVVPNTSFFLEVVVYNIDVAETTEKR